MVEAIANSIEDKLIDGLSFKLSPGASYVQERKSVTYHPQGSNIYTAIGGTKLIKMLITGDGWVDPSTFRIMFDLRNNESVDKELRPIGGPWSFFKRLRILCAGAVVEDITEYSRVHEMFSTLTAPDSRTNVDMEGFGRNINIRDTDEAALTALNLSGILPGQAQTVLFKPLSGLFNQNKFLPVRYAPITIELELVNDAIEPILSKFGTEDPVDGPFTAANTSLAWQIENVQAKLDLCTLDNGFENQYAEHLLEGKPLPINYNTYVSQMQSLYGDGTNGQKDVRINVSRALTRLKSVFVTFYLKSLDGSSKNLKEWNTFYSPMKAYATPGKLSQYNSNGEFEYQLQVGSKLFPEFPIRSHSEGYYQLRKCLGVQSSAVHNFDINSHEYRTSKFILGLDLERVLEAGFTGMNTRAGDLMSILFKHSDATAANYATSMHTVLHSDNILEIRDAGCQVFD